MLLVGFTSECSTLIPSLCSSSARLHCFFSCLISRFQPFYLSSSHLFSYRVLDGSAPTYLNALVRANVTPRMLRSSSERRLALPSVQVRQSRLFLFVVPCWWNELPSTTRAGASLSTFKKLLKTQLFREHLPSKLDRK